MHWKRLQNELRHLGSINKLVRQPKSESVRLALNEIINYLRKKFQCRSQNIRSEDYQRPDGPFRTD